MSTFIRQVTSEQLEEEKRKATADGMRELAEAMKKRVILNPEEEHMSNDSDESDDCSYEMERRVKKRPRVIDSNFDKLESRIRYLQLDLTNAHVDIEDAKAKAEQLSNQLVPMKRVNDELSFLKSSLIRALQNTEKLSKIQLEAKFKLFKEEANEHASLCTASINKIEFDEVKVALLRVLAAERKRIVQTEKNFNYIIMKTHIKERTIHFAICLSILVALFAIIYPLMFYFV